MKGKPNRSQQMAKPSVRCLNIYINGNIYFSMGWVCITNEQKFGWFSDAKMPKKRNKQRIRFDGLWSAFFLSFPASSSSSFWSLKKLIKCSRQFNSVCFACHCFCFASNIFWCATVCSAIFIRRILWWHNGIWLRGQCGFGAQQSNLIWLPACSFT